MPQMKSVDLLELANPCCRLPFLLYLEQSLSSCGAGRELKRLLSKINKVCTRTKAIFLLKQLRKVPTHTVQEHMGDVVWTMSALMHNVSSGVGGHTPHSLHNLAEIVHRHPALLPQLQ